MCTIDTLVMGEQDAAASMLGGIRLLAAVPWFYRPSEKVCLQKCEPATYPNIHFSAIYSELTDLGETRQDRDDVTQLCSVYSMLSWKNFTVFADCGNSCFHFIPSGTILFMGQINKP